MSRIAGIYGSNKKGLSLEITEGQYAILHGLLMDAYNRGYDQRPHIDTQTFDNLVDNVENAKPTYLSNGVK
tara:strand:+ start:4223 stop:4435 length:213 start_codon:yes stop_codon:yes gene_type:complete